MTTAYCTEHGNQEIERTTHDEDGEPLVVLACGHVQEMRR